jgi:hypothetical protein
METFLKSQPSMQEPFGLLKIRIGFGDNGVITKKQDVLQKIDQ